MEDFIATPSETMATETETIGTTQDTQSEADSIVETQEMTEETKPFTFELQYNKEKVVIDSEDKLRELAQKGMNYEKVYTKAQELEKDPMRSWAYDYMKQFGYTDPNKFIDDIRAQQESDAFEQRVKEYVDKGYGEDVARELAAIKKENQELQSKFQQMTTKSQQEKDYADFLEWHDSMQKQGVFKESLDPGKIPTEVWQAVNNGVPLKYAYMEHMLPTLRTNTEQEVIKNMQKNAATSTGSVKDNTTTTDVPWTREYIEQMAEKHGSKWVMQNYEKIDKSGYFR